MATKVYNNYSPELLSHFPKIDREKGQKLMFQVLGIRYDPIMKKNIIPQTHQWPAIDRIWDPWNRRRPNPDRKNSDDAEFLYDGDYVDIAFITGERPTAPDSARESNIAIGEIVFRRELVGAIEYAGEKSMEQMCRFLFFCNLNESNSTGGGDSKKEPMPWYIKPQAGHIYKVVRPDEQAKKALGSSRLVDRAKIVIDDFSDDKLKEIAKGLFPSDYLYKSADEIVIKLRSIAEKNPEKILKLSEDVDVKMNLFVNECVEQGLIEFDTTKWVWADDKGTICTVKPGQTQFSSIKTFFLTDAGVSVMETLEKLKDAKAAPSKGKTKDKEEKKVIEKV